MCRKLWFPFRFYSVIVRTQHSINFYYDMTVNGRTADEMFRSNWVCYAVPDHQTNTHKLLFPSLSGQSRFIASNKNDIFKLIRHVRLFNKGYWAFLWPCSLLKCVRSVWIVWNCAVFGFFGFQLVIVNSISMEYELENWNSTNAFDFW